MQKESFDFYTIPDAYRQYWVFLTNEEKKKLIWDEES